MDGKHSWLMISYCKNGFMTTKLSNEYSKCSSNFKRLLSKKTLQEVFLMVDHISLQEITFLQQQASDTAVWCGVVCADLDLKITPINRR